MYLSRIRTVQTERNFENRKPSDSLEIKATEKRFLPLTS